MASKKIECVITGDWQYCNEARYNELVAKYGSEEQLREEYTTRKGQKFIKQAEGDIEKAKELALAEVGDGKNKIACIVTGEKMFISPERMEKLKTSLATDEDGVRAQYVSRVANRLRKEAAAEHEKKFEELDEETQNRIDDALRERFENGDWPAPSAPKGSRADKPVRQPRKKKSTETKVISETPNASELDPLRHIEGEDSRSRKNRIRRERAAIARAAK